MRKNGFSIASLAAYSTALFSYFGPFLSGYYYMSGYVYMTGFQLLGFASELSGSDINPFVHLWFILFATAAALFFQCVNVPILSGVFGTIAFVLCLFYDSDIRAVTGLEYRELAFGWGSSLLFLSLIAGTACAYVAHFIESARDSQTSAPSTPSYRSSGSILPPQQASQPHPSAYPTAQPPVPPVTPPPQAQAPAGTPAYQRPTEIRFSQRPTYNFVCPLCGNSQEASRTFCWNCGVKFLFEGEDNKKDGA